MTPPPPQSDECPPCIEFRRTPGSWTLTIRTRARQVSFRRTVVGWVITDLVLLAGWIWEAMGATHAHPFDIGSVLMTLACIAFVQVMSIRAVHHMRADALRRDAEPPEGAPTA